MFAPFRTGRSSLLWSGVFSVLLVRAILASSNTLDTASEALKRADDFDEKIDQDLKSGRVIFSIGMMKSRLVVLVSHDPVSGFMDEEGWCTTDPSLPTAAAASSAPIRIVPRPEDHYVYDMPSSAFTPAGKLYLHGGVLLKDKWPSLHDWLVNSDNNGKKESEDDWLQDYAYMFVSDMQHEHLVMIEIPTGGYHRGDVASSFLIDKTIGAGEQVKEMHHEPTENLKVKICSNEPMSFNYLNVQNGATRQTIPFRLGDSSLGQPNRDFALGKQAFNGSTSLAEATGFTDVGQIYAICKSGESEIVTQETRAQLCTVAVDWDIRLGFVDSADRMVLLDEHMTMRSFPRSALTPESVGKPVQVETKLKGLDATVILFIWFILIGCEQSRQFGHRAFILICCLYLTLYIDYASGSMKNTTYSLVPSSSKNYPDFSFFDDPTQSPWYQLHPLTWALIIVVILLALFIADVCIEAGTGVRVIQINCCVQAEKREKKKKNKSKRNKEHAERDTATERSLQLQSMGGTTGSSIESSAIERARAHEN